MYLPVTLPSHFFTYFFLYFKTGLLAQCAGDKREKRSKGLKSKVVFLLIFLVVFLCCVVGNFILFIYFFSFWRMPSFFGLFGSSQERELNPRVASKLLLGCILRRVHELNEEYSCATSTSSLSLSSLSSSLSFLSSPRDYSQGVPSSENIENLDLSSQLGGTRMCSTATEDNSKNRICSCHHRGESFVCDERREDSLSERNNRRKERRRETSNHSNESSLEQIKESLSSVYREDSVSPQSSNASTACFSSCAENDSAKSSCSSSRSSLSLRGSSVSTSLYGINRRGTSTDSQVLQSKKESKKKLLHLPGSSSLSTASVRLKFPSGAVSPFLLANIASFMTSPDITLLMVSRRTIQTVESIGDSFGEGDVVSRSGRMQDIGETGSAVGQTHNTSGGGSGDAQFRYIQTNHQHVVAATTEGIFILSPFSQTMANRFQDEERVVGDDVVRSAEGNGGSKGGNAPRRRSQIVGHERTLNREVENGSERAVTDSSPDTCHFSDSHTSLGSGPYETRTNHTTPPIRQSPTTRWASSPPSSSPSTMVRPSTTSPSPYLQVVGQQQLNHPSELICSMACSPDGDFIITGFENGSISVYYCYCLTYVSPSKKPIVCSVAASSTSSSKVSMHLLYDFAAHTDAVNRLQVTQKYRGSKFAGSMNEFYGYHRDAYRNYLSPYSSSFSTSLGCREVTPEPRSSSSSSTLASLFAEATPLLLYSAGADGRICQWDLEKGTLCHCIHYHERGLLVFEVSYWSGLIAIATNRPMLVVHRAREKRLPSSSPPSSGMEPYATAPADVPPSFSSSDEEERDLDGDTRRSWMDRLEQHPSDSSARRMHAMETGTFLMRTYPFPSSAPPVPAGPSPAPLTGSSPSPSPASSSTVPTQEVWYECPRMMLEMETLISGSHQGPITGAKFTKDSEWIVTLGEDEVITLSSIKEPRRMFRCVDGLTRHTCMGLFNVLLSVCIIASPPTSSVIVVLACGSDGTVIQWLVDTRNGRSSHTKKMHAGALISVAMYERVPRRILYF